MGRVKRHTHADDMNGGTLAGGQTFAETEPGVVSTSSSGAVGTAETVARGDHSHDLGAHDHSDATKGGTISLDHTTVAGKTAGHVLMATGAATKSFKQLAMVDYAALPIALAVDGAAAPASLAALSATNSVAVRKFAGDTADEDVFFLWQAPPDLDPAVPVSARVVFFITEATAPDAEGVVFNVAGGSLGNGDALSASLGSAAASALAGRSDAQGDRLATAWADVTIANLAAGETVILSLSRDQDAEGDTYAQDVGVAALELRFTRNPACS